MQSSSSTVGSSVDIGLMIIDGAQAHMGTLSGSASKLRSKTVQELSQMLENRRAVSC